MDRSVEPRTIKLSLVFFTNRGLFIDTVAQHRPMPMTNSPGVKYPAPPPELPDSIDFQFGQCSPTWTLSQEWNLIGQGFGVSCSKTSPNTDAAWLRVSTNHAAFGAVLRCVGTQGYVGQLQFAGRLQTENISGGSAGLWIQVRALNGDTLANADMSENGIRGTTPLTEYELSVAVPKGATQVCFGVSCLAMAELGLRN